MPGIFTTAATGPSSTVEVYDNELPLFFLSASLLYNCAYISGLKSSFLHVEPVLQDTFAQFVISPSSPVTISAEVVALPNCESTTPA